LAVQPFASEFENTIPTPGSTSLFTVAPSATTDLPVWTCSFFGSSQVMLTVIEAHICIYQTAMDLMDRDIDVNVIADAVSSRTPENKHIALQRLNSEGALLSTTEMALFELLKDAKHENFKEIAKLVK
ncbi:hypothetical protein LCGC14_2631970, partial [marine sediment metagenome]